MPRNEHAIKYASKGLFNNLVKRFTFLDHAKVFTRMLFYRIKPLLEVQHLGIECSIAFLQAFIFLLQRCDFLMQVPDIQQPPVTGPELVLQYQQQYNQKDDQLVHKGIRQSAHVLINRR